MEIANQLKLKVSIKDEIVYVKIIQAAQERQLDSPLSLLIDRIIHLHVKVCMQYVICCMHAFMYMYDCLVPSRSE